MKRSMMMTLLLAALPLGACVKEQMIAASSTTSASGLAPSLVVEQFMRAVNSEPKDLNTMARLFGTKDGPISERDPRSQVEQRMFAIASVLKYDDYEIARENIVPGRTGEAIQLMVRVTRNKQSNTVPFTLVRYKENSWLIEAIGINVITNQR
jgi:hypothetical protein